MVHHMAARLNPALKIRYGIRTPAPAFAIAANRRSQNFNKHEEERICARHSII